MKPIMVFPFGTWKTKKYGDIPLTEELADKIIANFDAKVLGRDPFIDELHQEGQSTGWVKRLFKQGGALFADIEWTDLGRDLLTKKIYRYFSMTLATVKNPTTGEWHKNVLIGGALCNNPVLSMMPAIELSFSEHGAEHINLMGELEPSDPPSEGNQAGATGSGAGSKIAMSEEEEKSMKELRALLGLSESDDVLGAVTALKTAADKVTGLETEVKTLSEKITAQDDPGTVRLSTADYAGLKADAAAGKAAGEQIYAMRKNTAITAALNEGRINPKERPDYERRFDNFAKIDSIEAAEGFLADLPIRIDLGERGTGEGGTDGDASTLEAAINLKLSEGKAKDYVSAYELVASERPDLVEKHLRAV